VQTIEVVTSADRPYLADEADEAFSDGWPEFIFHDPMAAQYSKRVEELFPQLNILLLADGKVVAGGWGVALRWDDALPDGYDGALAAAVEGNKNGVTPNTLSVMAAAVRSDLRGGGLAGQVLTALKERAADLEKVIAPVRPTLKSRYPLTSMEDFATWMRPDGLHLDAWIRTHQRLGAIILTPAHRSMLVKGTIAEWESWTGMVFPQSGKYVIPQALDLLDIDRDRDLGTYEETNLWMRHR
jgi:GNAT superfamily N-acetyltransferase